MGKHGPITCQLPDVWEQSHKFMPAYGLDGVEIDWEYPGAPDRGGQPDDIANFPLLMHEIRSTFDRTGRKYGLSFTAPTAFWYPRWFDLPQLASAVEWINVMSYGKDTGLVVHQLIPLDFHGEWDHSMPLEALLRPISISLRLNWRWSYFGRSRKFSLKPTHSQASQNSPKRICDGYGFYGRFSSSPTHLVPIPAVNSRAVL
jgi:chitinase